MCSGGRVQDPSKARGWRGVPDILSYEPVSDVWVKQSQMKYPRLSHGVSAVAVTEDILRACRTERTVRDNSVYGALTLIIVYHGFTPSTVARNVDHRRLPRSSQQDGPEICRVISPLQQLQLPPGRDEVSSLPPLPYGAPRLRRRRRGGEQEIL